MAHPAKTGPQGRTARGPPFFQERAHERNCNGIAQQGENKSAVQRAAVPPELGDEGHLKNGEALACKNLEAHREKTETYDDPTVVDTRSFFKRTSVITHGRGSVGKFLMSYY